MATLKEVAVAARGSTVTASSVLSGVNRVRVSPATAARIHNVAKSMNYVPLASARGLRMGKTHIIAFVASSHNTYSCDDVWHESLRGVSDLMWAREERLMLVMSRNPEDELEIIRQMAYGRQVDGFIVQDTGDEDRIRMLVDSGRPFVMMGGVSRPDVHSVSFDMRSFAADIAESLSADQCGAVLLIPPHNLNPGVYAPFLEYFQSWSRDNGIGCEIWRGAFIPDASWFARMKESLNGRRFGVALLRGLLPEAIMALEEAGFVAGETSSLVYVSAGEEVLLGSDRVSVMHFDNYTLGRRSARLLLGIVDNAKDPAHPESVIIPAAQKE